MTREVSDAIAIQGANNLDGASLHSVGSPSYNFSYINVSDSERDAHLHNGDFHQNGHAEHTMRDEAATPLPIDLLPGELYEDSADFDDCRVVLTNFRLCIISLQDQSIAVVSLMSIETVNFTDLQISVVCRDGKVYRLISPSMELAIHWHKRLMKVPTRSSVGEAFAWDFASAVASSSTSTEWLVDDEEKDYCQIEWKLLGFDPDYFKIMDDNNDYGFSDTYPRRIIVPKMDKDLLALARDYRFLGRFPAVVYVFKDTKAVLLRSSQPKCGFLNWRCVQDEQILEEVNKFTAAYAAPGSSAPSNVIMDARSYAAAWANRAKGGGFENPDCYGTNTKSTFLGLPNIHNVRYAFVQLRNVLSTEKTDQNTYLQSISTTNWLQYLGGVMSAANECVSLLSQGTSVLVHCSDGWDRTSQIVSLAKLLADERYRTIEGFELLVRREWIEFGHKFADRNAVHGNDNNERCPVFLQWLDAVCQCYKQHPTAFEFNQQYIIKLAQHAYSGLFGTFLFNSMSEAAKEMKARNARPVSIWRFLGRHNEEVVNQDYDSCITGKLVVQSGIQNLQVWREFYCTEASGNYGVPEGTTVLSSPALTRTPATSPMKDSTTVMVKSKSSESISSLGNPDALASGLTVAHSESNGTLNTAVADHHAIESSVMGESSLFRRDARSLSVRSRKPRNIKDLVDNDGMIKFCDPQQEIQRRKNRKHKDELKKKDAQITQITDLQRKRSSSEKTNYSLRSRDRMISGDLDSEFDNMSMDRAMSDMSLVDNNEIVLPASSGGWSVNQDACALCKMQFSALSLKPEDRKHHCRQCGKTVCDACSKNTYHHIHEGRGVQVRACKDCYAMMSSHNNDDILTEEDEENTSLARPRSRTDTIMRHPDESPFRFNTTQTVKG